MRTIKIDRDIYTELLPADIWKVYTHVNGLFCGSGNTMHSKIAAKGVRGKDFDLRFDEQEKIEFVFPNPRKGLSFSDSIERLQKLPIRGVVWKLPKNTELPRGLVINYKNNDLDHPLINVERPMSVVDLILKLKYLASKMECTNIRIK